MLVILLQVVDVEVETIFLGSGACETVLEVGFEAFELVCSGEVVDSLGGVRIMSDDERLRYGRVTGMVVVPCGLG